MTPLMVSIEKINVEALLFSHQSTDDYFKLGADGADASARQTTRYLVLNLRVCRCIVWLAKKGIGNI
eukprot:COSAG02_NODE_201_length_29473_cov_135.510213_18_plen_67_part_00